MKQNKIYKGLDIPENIYFVMKNSETINEYIDELSKLNSIWMNLEFLSKFGNLETNISLTKQKFSNLTMSLLFHLCQETLHKIVREMGVKTQNAIDVLIRNLYERTADIGFLATDDEIRNFLIATVSKYDEHYKENKSKIVARFKEYVLKYSVYFDVVLMDKKGNILVNLNDKTNIDKSHDSIVSLAINSSDAFLESYKFHDFAPNVEKSLVYACKITKDNSPNSDTIGVLALCFRFNDETKGIFANLVNNSNKECLMLLDKNGAVIASSDKYYIPIGATMELCLDEPYKIISFGGRDYIAKSAKTNGYQNFYGQCWYAHIIIPLQHGFNSFDIQDIDMKNDLILAILQNGREFSDELKRIPVEANIIQEELNRSLWNGNINNANSQNINKEFSQLIFAELGLIGNLTKEVFRKSIGSLVQTMILNNTTQISMLMVDIMDRNLYERANDCRWWALTSVFRDILEKNKIETSDTRELVNILMYINGLYTVYKNIILYDKQGVIIAVSDSAQLSLIGKKINATWVQNTLVLKKSSDYCVSNFEKSEFNDYCYTYIYNAAIKNHDNTINIGGIALVFDSATEFNTMLKEALPKDNNKKIKLDTFALYAARNRQILASTNHEFEVGGALELDSDFFGLENGKSLSKIIRLNGKYYAVGATCSKGYREYKGVNDIYSNDVIAIYFSYISEANLEIKKPVQTFDVTAIDYGSQPTAEIASFYIGTKWLGINAKDAIEAVGIAEMEKSIDVNSDSVFKGTVIYKNNAVSVLDISSFIQEPTDNQFKEIIIIKYKYSNQNHFLGLLVNQLGDISQVLSSKIKPVEQHFISGGTLIESIVVPDENAKSGKLLTIINIEKINNLRYS